MVLYFVFLFVTYWSMEDKFILFFDLNIQSHNF